MSAHEYPIQVYYEDTDHSGVVYHANYLKYFERAREHMLGIDELVALYRTQNVGFVVYKADLTYQKGAEFGDMLTIRSTVIQESPYRLLFNQQAFRGSAALVIAKIQLACVQHGEGLIRIPTTVVNALQASGYQETD
jgi:acyl-CoA thioester hydrolase